MENPCTLIIITGLPCTGKSRLAELIRERFNLPLVNKDGIKETLFDSPLGKDPLANDFTRAWSKKLGEATYELLFWCVEVLLQAGISCIAESNFSCDRHSARFQELQKKYGCRILQVQFVADGDELLFRFQQRWESGQRHPGHVDDGTVDEIAEVLKKGRLEPLGVDGPYLEVDTTDFESVDVEAVIEWIEANTK